MTRKKMLPDPDPPETPEGAYERGIAEERTCCEEKHKAYIKELCTDLESVFTLAGNRWSEWGDRAESVCEALENILNKMKENNA